MTIERYLRLIGGFFVMLTAQCPRDRWTSEGPAEERHGISLSQLLAMALEATRVICAA